jgi:hypothetical protein
MKFATTALAVSGLKRPTRPSTAAKAKIVRAFKLSDVQAHELRLVIDHFMADVDGYLQELERIPPRSERAGRLRRIEKALRRVKYEVEKSGKVLDHLLPFDQSERLGSKHTFTAISDVVGSPQAPPNVDAIVQDIITRDGRLSIQALETALEYKRRALGLKYPGAIFRAMINDLYAPLGDWVERDKRISGRKPLIVRNRLIERLAEASEDILGARATSTAKGRFVGLCAAVLDAMKIPSDGVEKAVVAVLKNRKAKSRANAESRPQSAGGWS